MSSSTHTASAPPPPAIAQGIGHLKALTGLDFTLAPNGVSLDYEGPVPIPVFDRLYELGRRGAVMASINYPLRQEGASTPKLSVTAFDAERLSQLCAQEPERKRQGEAAALVLSRVTGKIWAFDGYCVVTKTPETSDKLFKQLEYMKERGVLSQQNPWNILEVTAPGEQTQSYLSLHEIDLARLRAIAPSLQSLGQGEHLSR